MTQPSNSGSAMFTIYKIIDPLEWVALAGAVIGYLMKTMAIPGADETLMLGLSVLAGVYFLQAYKPINLPDDGRKKGFADLLATSIIPKVAWIGCATTVIGCLFRLLHLNGALEQLMLGCAILVISIFIMVIFLITDSGPTAVMTRILYRAVPVCLFGAYLFLVKPA